MIMDQEPVILYCKYLHHSGLHIGAYRYWKATTFKRLSQRLAVGALVLFLMKTDSVYIFFDLLVP